MSSTHPYLIRAIFEWAMDKDFTPHLLVDAELEGVVVPRQFVKDGAIVLNISPSAVRDLDIGEFDVTFNARFGGVPMHVVAPIRAVRAVYARENGEGIVLPHQQDGGDPDDNGPDTGGAGDDNNRPQGPKLTVVK